MAYVCAECREGIDREATTCPHCGHEGDDVSGAFGVFMFLIGGVFTATVIGAIIGVPLMYFGHRRMQAGEDVSPGVEA